MTTHYPTTQEVAMTNYLDYQLTGDVLADRAAWKAAGCPSDHPYIVDAKRRSEEPVAPVSPLAITLTAAQEAYMAEAGPVMRAQSDANVAAMLRSGK